MIKVKTAVCVLCGQEYTAQTHVQGYQGLCPEHWSNDTLRELDRIESARASVLKGAPDTLNLAEWMGIITRYRGKCALCRIVHFSKIAIWLPAAGLVAGNVVPLCTACHFHASHSWGDQIERVGRELGEA